MLNSPYIIDVYRYDDINNEYIMELMDCSLDKYIEKHNTAMDIGERKYSQPDTPGVPIYSFQKFITP